MLNTLTARALIPLLAALSVPALAAEPGVVPANRMVNTEWLAAHSGDPDVRVLDMRYGVKFYWEGHIPGAVFLHPDALRLADHGTPEKPMPAEILASMLGRMGIDRNTTVVIYAEEVDSLAPYLIWQLDCLGHERSAVLACGFDKWLAEGRPSSQDYPTITPGVYAAPVALDASVRATKDDVKREMNTRNAVLLDVRPRAQFTGAKGPWIRKGRIPGAVSRDWVEDMVDGAVLKDSATLSQAYAAIGITPDKPVIVYCGKGLRSTNTWFVLKYVLGLPDVKVYDGSFSEWAADPSLPVETGEPQN